MTSAKALYLPDVDDSTGGGKYEVGGGEEALADGGSEEVGEEVGEKVGLVVEEASEGKGGDISQGGEEVEDEAGEE
eukprot:gene15749-18674_t